MGRKALFNETKQKKGPGRKAKKQKDPVFPFLQDEKRENQKLSHRQKQRMAKRNLKQQERRNALKVKRELKAKQVINGKPESDKKKNEKLLKSKDEDDSEIEEDTMDVSENGNLSDTSDNDIEQNDESTDDSDDDSDGEENDDNMAEIGEESDSDDDNEAEIGEENEAEIGEESDSEDDNEAEIGEENDSDDDNEAEIDEENSDDDGDDDNSIDGDECKVGTLDDLGGTDEDDEELPIEKEAKKLNKKRKREEEDAEEEMQLNIANREMFAFPSEEEIEKPLGIPEIGSRIKDVLMVLSNFKKFRDGSKSRKEYIDLLKKDLCSYFSYNEYMMDKMVELFPLTDLMDFLEASETQRPLTIRTNSLKTRRKDLAQSLIARGVNLDPIGKWTKVGLVVYNSSVPVGATPEYLAGHYIIQGASSLLPVMALAPKENEKILDLCAAPGGKASHIAAVMKNTGVLFANDSNKDRCRAIVGNFHRLGVINSVISCIDGRKFTQVMPGGFDRVLVDAPCSGTGIISKDPSVKTTKDEVDIQRCTTLQRQLILSAIDCLKFKSQNGGYLVYSTCSILPEENECIIEYAMKKRDVKLVETGLDFGENGFTHYRQYRFHPSMKLTKRYYPHTHNMDGFFVAKLKKLSNKILDKSTKESEDEEEEEVEEENNDEEAESREENNDEAESREGNNDETGEEVDEVETGKRLNKKPKWAKKKKHQTQEKKSDQTLKKNQKQERISHQKQKMSQKQDGTRDQKQKTVQKQDMAMGQKQKMKQNQEMKSDNRQNINQKQDRLSDQKQKINLKQERTAGQKQKINQQQERTVGQKQKMNQQQERTAGQKQINQQQERTAGQKQKMNQQQERTAGQKQKNQQQEKTAGQKQKMNQQQDRTAGQKQKMNQQQERTAGQKQKMNQQQERTAGQKQMNQQQERTAGQKQKMNQQQERTGDQKQKMNKKQEVIRDQKQKTDQTQERISNQQPKRKRMKISDSN